MPYCPVRSRGEVASLGEGAGAEYRRRLNEALGRHQRLAALVGLTELSECASPIDWDRPMTASALRQEYAV